MQLNRTKLEPLVPENDAETLYKGQRRKSGKPRQWLYLLLVIFAVVASKFYIRMYCYDESLWNYQGAC